jgi:tRNA threonylcarbamoyladenosine biosynthesis protein TsaE
MSVMNYQTSNEQGTKKLAADFAKSLHGGEIVFLQGDLGSGKTTFVRGVAESFGFLEPVRSPSFTIMNRYPVEHGAIKQILHVDFYRIKDPVEIPPLALEEEVGKTDTITFIEWPESIPTPLQPTHRISFVTTGTEHIITLE